MNKGKPESDRDLIGRLMDTFKNIPKKKWIKLLNVSDSTYSHWKTGRRAIPSDTRRIIEVVLSIEEDDLKIAFEKYLLTLGSKEFFEQNKSFYKILEELNV